MLNAIALWRRGVTSPEIAVPGPILFDQNADSGQPGRRDEFTETDPGHALPEIKPIQMSQLPDGDLLLCPARPSGIQFLEQHRAWGFIRLQRTPSYLALYISQPISAIEYLGEVEKVIDPATEKTSVGTDYETYRPGRKLVMFCPGRLWHLSQPVERGGAGPDKTPQGPRFITLGQLAQAQTLNDL